MCTKTLSRDSLIMDKMDSKNGHAPITPSSFDINSVKFDTLYRNPRGGKSIKISYDGIRGYVRIQTPPVYLPFGLSIYDEEDRGKNNNVSTSLDCSLRTDGEDAEKMNKFVTMMESLDNAVFDHCVVNSMDCFGKKMAPDVLREDFFRPIIRPGRAKPDGTSWPRQMRVKISPMALPKVFDVDRNEIPWESEAGQYKRHTVRLILQLQPIWFVQKTFGMSLRLHQMIILDAPASEDRCMFLDDGDFFAARHPARPLAFPANGHEHIGIGHDSADMFKDECDDV
jgi:hypothetical protein